MDQLIPLSWFVDQPTWALILLSGVALAGLIKAAGMLVDGIAGIAFHFRVSKVVVAATVLSLGTTSPETAVSVMAAIAGQPGLALGNAVGSVVCNAALIVGIGCSLGTLPAERFVLRRQGAWMLFAGVLLTTWCFIVWGLHPQSPQLGRGTGVVFLLLLGVYVVMSVLWSRRHPRGEPFVARSAAEHPQPTRKEIDRPLTPLALLSVGGLLLVLLTSRIFVAALTVLSERWGIPPVIVAATIVSVGTSLPELVVSITSVLKGHGEMLIGNVIGANILNILWVLGASALARPLPLLMASSDNPRVFLLLHLPAMLLTLGVFCLAVLLAERRGKFARSFGPILLGMYVGYIALQFAFR